MPVACGVYCYGVTIFIILLIIALFLFIFFYVLFTDLNFLFNGEFMYRFALPLFFIIIAGFALIIPRLMHRYGVDTWPTYSCLATVDEEAEVECTPCTDANDRDNCDQYAAFEDMTS